MEGRLARAYRDGVGVERNIQESIKWYSLAIDHKNKWAKNELNQLNNEIAYSLRGRLSYFNISLLLFDHELNE